MGATLRRVLIGQPLPTERLVHERITKFKGLAVSSSDALSSTADATEEILLALMAAGAALRGRLHGARDGGLPTGARDLRDAYFRRRQGSRVAVVTDVPYYPTRPSAVDLVSARPTPALRRPLTVLGTLAVLLVAAFALAGHRHWPVVVQEALGLLVVLLLGVFAILLILRSMVAWR